MEEVKEKSKITEQNGLGKYMRGWNFLKTVVCQRTASAAFRIIGEDSRRD